MACMMVQGNAEMIAQIENAWSTRSGEVLEGHSSSRGVVACTHGPREVSAMLLLTTSSAG